jgi:hypothetical protein
VPASKELASWSHSAGFLASFFAMSESSSSRTARLGLEARATEPSGLPLIQCPICKKEQVLELVSKSPRNYIERVFKCPKKYIQVNDIDFFI